MKASDIKDFGLSVTIEMADCDALLCLTRKAALDQFIAANGDVQVIEREWTVEPDGEVIARYMVPEFATSRRLYSEAKAKDCARYGCE